jgi:hypothetical protein
MLKKHLPKTSRKGTNASKVALLIFSPQFYVQMAEGSKFTPGMGVEDRKQCSEGKE